MYRINKERLKTCILLVLLATSLVQVGILWDYQNHGFPINFFMSVIKGAASGSYDADMASEEFFKPFRIVVSDGGKSHWLIDRRNELHGELWNEAKTCLKAIMASPRKNFEIYNGDWGDVAIRKGAVFEFKARIKSGLLKWFLEMADSTADEPAGLCKMKLIPGYGNENVGQVYVLDGNTIYRYDAKIGGGKNGSENVVDYAVAKLKQDKRNEINAYNVFREVNPWGKINISQDALCVMGGTKYRQFRSINYCVPEKASSFDQMAGVIFRGNEKDSYNLYRDANDTIAFINPDNMYRIHGNGLLEYKYMAGPASADKGAVSAAFDKAARFVGRIAGHLPPGADIYISGITEEKDFYRFSFDYIVEGFPVYFNIKPSGKEREPAAAVMYAITVEADGKRVLGCRWMIKRFEQGGSMGSYNVNLVDILDLSAKYDKNKDFVKDMGVAYVVEADDGRDVEPVWAIELAEGGLDFVRMSRQRGN